MKVKKERLDLVLVKQGLASTRAEAQRLVMAGKVVCGGEKLTKAGFPLAPDSALELVGKTLPYVGRGGLKLEAALAAFALDPTGLAALDVGASTGGFTDCLLQKGAASVVALDVGFNQLAWKIRTDPRVTVLEKTNIRHLDPARFSPFSLIVIDVSFISLQLVLPTVASLLQPDGVIVSLIKPQFEVGKGLVGKKGIVKDPFLHRTVLLQVQRFAAANQLTMQGVIASPIYGAKGNREFLGLFRPAGFDCCPTEQALAVSIQDTIQALTL